MTSVPVPPRAPAPLVTPANARRALRIALSGGGDWAELFWELHQRLRVTLDDGRVQDAIGGVDQGAGIRVVSRGRTRYANANLAAEGDLIALARRAARAVGEESSAPVLGALTPDVIPGHSTVLIDPREVPLERKVSLLRRADAAARGVDARVRQVTATYAESVQAVIVANSEGLFRPDTRVQMTLTIEVVATEETALELGAETLHGTAGFELLDDEAIDRAALRAARRAVRNLHAEAAPAGTHTVVLSSEAGGTLIHETVGHGLEADLNVTGLSVYAGRLGDEVATTLITVVDDGTDAGRRGTAAIDDEGTPTQQTVLIDRGVLRGYMTDREHAARLDLPRTGNGRRESFRNLPLCRMTNTRIAPGASDPADILRSVKDGIFVSKMGVGQVDVTSGDFAFEIAECRRIKDGHLAEPLRGATLVGHAPTIMREIDMVGSDLGYATGTCGKEGQLVPVADAQPTLRIPSVVVGGKLR